MAYGVILGQGIEGKNINASQINGALTNATIDGGNITGNIAGSLISGNIANATIPANNVTGLNGGGWEILQEFDSSSNPTINLPLGYNLFMFKAYILGASNNQGIYFYNVTSANSLALSSSTTSYNVAYLAPLSSNTPRVVTVFLTRNSNSTSYTDVNSSNYFTYYSIYQTFFNSLGLVIGNFYDSNASFTIRTGTDFSINNAIVYGALYGLK